MQAAQSSPRGVLGGSVVGRRARSRGTVQAKTSSLPGAETSRSSSPRCRCWVDSEPRVFPSCPLPLPAPRPSPAELQRGDPGPLRLAFTGSSSSCRAVPAWDTSSLLPPVSPPSPAQETRAAASNPRHRVCVCGGRCSRPPGRSPSSTMRTEQACPKDSPRACLQGSPLPGRQTARGPRSETDACSLLGLPAGLRFFLRA